MKKLPELLAPAGNFSMLSAALNAGCDAVYFGVAGMNMREGAKNFQLEDLPEIVERCRAKKVKCYLTLNTIVFSSESERVEQILVAAAPYVDAVICWDHSVIRACRHHRIPVHISTQASVANADAAEFYKNVGAERIVPARECTIEELKHIRKTADVELELFVHGAMCVSVSGRCFLSDISFGKSANRGACLQNCRRKYRIMDAEEDGIEFELGSDYVMSARDLCTLPFLEQLLEAGMDSFKIEGRGRNPDYVHTVVTAYRKAIDAWKEDELTEELKSSLVEEVKTVFNREFSSGFFLGRPITEFMHKYGNRATTQKYQVGNVTNYFRKVGIAEINIINYTFQKGDQLLIQGPTTGVLKFNVEELRQDEKETPAVERGIATIPVPCRVRVNDEIYLIKTLET